MEKGDFTQLAGDYAKYRPSYNKKVVKSIIKAVGKKPCNIIASDIGAGTGIFTKCLIDSGLKNVIAVEPNINMRKNGIKFLGKNISFLKASAEDTRLESNNFDLVTMASAFHWTKKTRTLKEFDRILKKKGIFAALWNPRLTDRSENENKIQKLLSKKYEIRSRVSSGLSGITNELMELLLKSKIFSSVNYVEGIDVVKKNHKEYIGAWRSVNDIQVQLGKEKFSEFLKDIEEIIRKQPYIEVHYLTRAWIAKK